MGYEPECDAASDDTRHQPVLKHIFLALAPFARESPFLHCQVLILEWVNTRPA